MKRKIITTGVAAAVALTTLAPISAQAFTTPRGVKVNPVNDVVFEVIPKSSGFYGDFWCGASEYARRVQGADWTDRVYVVQGRSPSVTTNRRSAVQFTLSPEAANVPPPPQGWLALGIKAGGSMSVQQARTHCDQQPIHRN